MKLVRESLYNFHKTGDVKSGLNIGIRAKIKAWLDDMEVENYTINDDYTIDVNGDVSFCQIGISEFPDFIKFRYIKGYFDCSENQLKSLERGPQEVEGWFDCSLNHLKSLNGSPKRIGGSFHCEYNRLMTLDGAPNEVYWNFSCMKNPRKFTKEEVRSVCNVKKSIFV